MAQTPIDLLLSELPATRPSVALSEGSDPRVVAGALAAHHAGIALLAFRVKDQAAAVPCCHHVYKRRMALTATRGAT